ncbi:Sodium/hydrogen exchanger [Entamoeba marina]
MKTRNFVENLLPILSLAIGGCVLSSLMIGFGVYGYTFIKSSSISLESQNLTFSSSLQFGTLLGATDPVATLALFLELNVDPLLYSLVFGESVMNDAVSIVLFDSLTIGSCLIGVFVSYFSAFVMNKMKDIHLSGTLNLVLIICVAYLAYLISELLSMSGILSIFVTGAIMSHHHWYSIPENQRPTLYIAVGVMSFVSETFTFISVGITLFNPSNLESDYWNPLFIFYVLMLCFISRACNVFPISLIMNLRKGKKISFRHMLMLWFAGLRGAIAIILCVEMDNQIVTNTTYTIVLFTNIVIGLMTPPLLKLFRIQMGGDVPLNIRPMSPCSSSFTSIEEEKKKNKVHRLLSRFDETFLKKYFNGQTVHYTESDTHLDPKKDQVRTDRERLHIKFMNQNKPCPPTEKPLTERHITAIELLEANPHPVRMSFDHPGLPVTPTPEFVANSLRKLNREAKEYPEYVGHHHHEFDRNLPHIYTDFKVDTVFNQHVDTIVEKQVNTEVNKDVDTKLNKDVNTKLNKEVNTVIDQEVNKKIEEKELSSTDKSTQDVNK